MRQSGLLGLTISILALSWTHRPAAAVELRNDEDVKRYFATVCGYCHEGGGRHAGKGPQLMGSKRTDEYLMNRIATGRQGAMPAFGASLSVEDIEAIIRYIRKLKPEGASG
jgi:mono/diheme cytochrome c family protein